MEIGMIGLGRMGRQYDRTAESFADRLLAVMPLKFGGHEVKRT
jgi:6-phosphogluconate dehydrogenase (decarboxylating)